MQQPDVGPSATVRTYDGFRVAKGLPVWLRDPAYKPIHDRLTAKIRDEYGSPDERPSRHKGLYQDMELDKTEWSRKFRGFTKFSYDEIEFLARRFKAPPGWPFIDWHLADANRKAQELLERTINVPHPVGLPAPPSSAAPTGHTERRRRGGRK